MGISSNQARFLSLTSRQVDLENRVQQICQRRLRLSSELERVATSYNNSIGNRQMYTFNTSNSGISQLSIASLQALKDTNGNDYKLVGMDNGLVSPAYTGIKWISGKGFDFTRQNVVGTSEATARTSLNTSYGMNYTTLNAATAAGWKFTAASNTYSYDVDRAVQTGATPAAALIALNAAYGTSYDATSVLAAGWTLSGNDYTYNVAPQITLDSLGVEPTATEPEALEAAIRNGVISIASQADEFTQSREVVAGVDYELRDWRTLPVIADELFKGDDVDAEDKYDRTIAQINQQDKKLQLEQTSIEVEYKAVSSEKEAVKKILDTNASTSFKYFS